MSQVRVKFSRGWRELRAQRYKEAGGDSLTIHQEAQKDPAQTKIFCASFESPIGIIYIASTEKGVCKIALPRDSKSSFFGWINANFDTDGIVDDRKRNSFAIRQINEYFIGKRTKFELDIDLIGTAFQQRIWTEVAKTPYGTTVTYKQIARKVHTKGYRSVGTSISKNPLPIIIPCHRVIGSNHKLIGYAGGIKLKEYLLRLEGIILV